MDLSEVCRRTSGHRHRHVRRVLGSRHVRTRRQREAELIGLILRQIAREHLLHSQDHVHRIRRVAVGQRGDGDCRSLGFRIQFRNRPGKILRSCGQRPAVRQADLTYGICRSRDQPLNQPGLAGIDGERRFTFCKGYGLCPRGLPFGDRCRIGSGDGGVVLFQLDLDRKGCFRTSGGDDLADLQVPHRGHVLVGQREACRFTAGDDPFVIVRHFHLFDRIGVLRIVVGIGICRVFGQIFPGISPVIAVVQRYFRPVGRTVLAELYDHVVGADTVDIILVVPDLGHGDLRGKERILQLEVVGPLGHLYRRITAVRAVAHDVADRACLRVHGEHPETVGQTLDAHGDRCDRRLNDRVDSGIQPGKADHAVDARTQAA